MPILTPSLIAAPTIGNVGRLADEGRDLFFDAARAQRVYEAARDRRLEPAQGRGIVLRLIDDAKGLVRSVTESLVARTVRLGTWFRAMRDALLPRHFAAGFAALNHAEPPPADLEAIADLSRGQLGYLERFRDQIATAAHILGGATPARAELYSSALWSVSQDVLRSRAKRDGFKYESNILGSYDACPGCLDATRAGVVPIGLLVPIGQRDCMQRCRCHLVFN